MSGDRAILLISDRTDRSQDLAQRLGPLGACRTIGLSGRETIDGGTNAVVVDAAFHNPENVEHLRRLLAWPRAARVPIIAILRHKSHVEHVQAAALGATSLLLADAPFADFCAALAPFARPAMRRASLTPKQYAEAAGLQFGSLYGAAAEGGRIDKTSVDDTTDSIMAAVAEGGIRQWLEVVWTHDDVTYQHCLLVSGLAAEFAASLRFTSNDQKHLIRGALLHDLGKAKIPHTILNKPALLTDEERAIMRSHVRVGHDLLRAQGDYDSTQLEVVLRHHELLDGSGYPDGLSGARIGDLVRLVTVCDVYAALIERRPYKRPLEPAQAFKTLREMEGKLEGPLVRAFAKVVEKSAAPNGHPGDLRKRRTPRRRSAPPGPATDRTGATPARH
jgi:putative nucleotidyltransferase with HDIG domain